MRSEAEARSVRGTDGTLSRGRRRPGCPGCQCLPGLLCVPRGTPLRWRVAPGCSRGALPRTLAHKGLGNAYPLLCVLTMEGATVGGASTRSQVTLTYGLAAPRRLDLRRRWLQKCPPSPDHFSLVGAKPRFMTANTTLCIFQEEIV